MKKGVRWRIGIGLKMKTWEDFWLPNQTDFKVKICMHEDTNYVSILIDAYNKQWDRDLIYSNFNHFQPLCGDYGHIEMTVFNLK